MAKKKTVVEKIVEAVDHVIHPDAVQKPECPVTDAPCEKDCATDECQATVSEDIAQKLVDEGEAKIPAKAVIKSRNEESDYASHPKFAKFSKKGAE